MKSVLMPGPLKFLVAMGFSAPLFVIFSLNGVTIFGQKLSAREWWHSAAAYVFVLSMVATAIGAYLINRRNRKGLVLYIMAWVASDLSGLLATKVTHIPLVMHWKTFMVHLVLTVCIGFYLFFNKKVKYYFNNGNGSS